MPIPHIESDRLRFRPWRQEDLVPFAAFMADPITSKFIGGVMDTNAAWNKMTIYAGQWMVRGYGVWALEDKASGQFAGLSGLWHPQDWPEREIAWSIVPAFQGRGFATEAALRSRSYAYDELGWSTVASVVAKENMASRHVAMRLGAIAERTLINRGWECDLFRHPAPALRRS